MNGDVKVAGVAEKQLGLVTLDEVRKSGIQDRAWQHCVRSGLWIRVAPRVYRSASVASTFAQRCLAQVLSLGDDSALSHRSAAALLGLDNFREERVIHVTTSDRRVAARAGVRIHRCDPLRSSDLDARDEIRITSPVRTIVDLASCSTKRELENAVDSALRMGLTTLDRLSGRRDSLRVPRIATLDQVIDGMPNGGLHNRLERDYLDLSRRARLPDPRGQVNFHDGTTMFARADFFYDALRLVTEVSGHRTHSTRQARAADAKRHRRIVADGWQYIEYTSDEIFHEPASVINELRAFGSLAPGSGDSAFVFAPGGENPNVRFAFAPTGEKPIG